MQNNNRKYIWYALGTWGIVLTIIIVFILGTTWEGNEITGKTIFEISKEEAEELALAELDNIFESILDQIVEEALASGEFSSEEIAEGISELEEPFSEMYVEYSLEIDGTWYVYISRPDTDETLTVIVRSKDDIEIPELEEVLLETG